MRTLAALILALGVVVVGCSPSATGGGTPPGSISLVAPLAAFDQEAFREAEAKLRRDGREQAGIAKLGPGALEFVNLMDLTGTFLLLQSQTKMKALPSSSGRLAAPLRGFPPGSEVFGTYLMTTVLFNTLIEKQTYDTGHVTSDTPETCPCTITGTLDPTKDEVTVAGNKGTITTTITVTATVNGSKIRLDMKMKTEGEVRDATTGAVLYKVSNEATGHAEGDVCPDSSGIANASMLFTGREDYFDSTGAKTGSSVSESFGGQLRIKADDNAKLASVDIVPTGGGGDIMMRVAAQGAAPLFEKAWRSGMCIAVLVSPETSDVEAGSETTVTAKVKHKMEGNELDKPVEAKLESGVKTIEPSGQKQKAPATFKYTAGSESGDAGSVSFDSVSNRGIGHASARYTVSGGWTISAVGTSHEDAFGVSTNDFNVSIKDLKIKANKDGALTGSGTMTLSGTATSGMGICKGPVNQTLPITATGSVVGTPPSAVLRLTLYSPAVPGVMMTLTCTLPTGASITQALGAEGFADRWGEALGQIELPVDGGTKAINNTTAIGGSQVIVTAAGTFTVTKAKK
jgi:hypothetical protein